MTSGRVKGCARIASDDTRKPHARGNPNDLTTNAANARSYDRAFGVPCAAVASPRYPLVSVIPAILIAAAMLTPIVYLVIRASEAGSEIWPLVFRNRTAVIFWNTLKLAAGVSAATILIAVPYAWLTTRTDLPLRRMWDTIAPMPLVIPSYAGTLAIIGAVGPRGLVQGWLEPLGIDRLPSIYGYWGAWATLSLFTYPYVYLSVRAALRGLDPSLEEASRSLQSSSLRTFFQCTLPQLRPAIVSGALLSALYTVSDFGVVTLMRYDAFTRTIYTQYRSAFDRTLAAALGILLVLFALSLVMGEGALRNRGAYHRLGAGIRPGTSHHPARQVALARQWLLRPHSSARAGGANCHADLLGLDRSVDR